MSRIDITGERVGKLLVVRYLGVVGGSCKYLCVCDCGEEREIQTSHLRAGCTRSCGCTTKEYLSENSKTHGMYRTNTYKAWAAMKERVKDKNKPNYEGKGIKVCAGFQKFEYFLNKLGECPEGYSLERLNFDGHYSCGSCSECLEKGWSDNCAWIEARKQAWNRSTNVFYEYLGEQKCIAQIAEEAKVPYHILKWRLKAWDGDLAKALSEPVEKRSKDKMRGQTCHFNPYEGNLTGNSSQFPGVRWHERSKNWRVVIRVDGKDIYLGSYNHELEAHKVYQENIGVKQLVRK